MTPTLDQAMQQLTREHARSNARWWKHYTAARLAEDDAQRAEAGRRAWVRNARLALENAQAVGWKTMIAAAQAELAAAEGVDHA